MCELLDALLAQQHDSFEIVVVDQSTERPDDAVARIAELERDPRLRMLRFPPLSRLIGILIAGEDEDAVKQQSSRLGNLLRSLTLAPHFREIKALGPAPAPIAKLDDEFRRRILLRGASPASLHEMLQQGLRAFSARGTPSGVRIAIDVDPIDLL